MIKTWAVLFLLCASGAQARVFNLAKESFASYFSAGYGPVNSARDAAFAGETSAASSYTGQLTSMTGGEFGFVSAGQYLSWRFSFEAIKPPVVRSTARSATSALYDVKSDITGFMPKLGLDINLFRGSAGRVYITSYVGQASFTITNDYSSVTIVPTTDFTEKYKGNAQVWSAGLGFEFAAFDTTSLTVEAGYRRMAVNELIYGAAVSADFSNTARAVGEAVYLANGERRKIDFSGFYATLGARFWLF